MIAISDQGPLHYLILIGCDHVLPQLDERVIAPRVVIEKEMGDPATPEPVRTWAANPHRTTGKRARGPGPHRRRRR